MSPLVATALTAPTGEWRCNSGFGRQPQQRTSIRASLLGDTGGPAGCPLVLSAALDFGGADPVAAVYALLAEAGIDNPEHLRRHCEHPAEPCICRPSSAAGAADRGRRAPGGAAAGAAAGPEHRSPLRPGAAGAADPQRPHPAPAAVHRTGVLRMNDYQFKALVGELIDENPFACRALLKILSVEFTDRVTTLAVTVSRKPRLLVNLDFVARHCRNDEHVKAVICHEFLHVLLRHTDRISSDGDAEHLALDAVINAIIHRTLGAPYSDFMAQYYGREKGLLRLLRPCELYLHRDSADPVNRAWDGLYQGHLVADDIRELAQSLAPAPTPGRGDPVWLGNHDGAGVDADGGGDPDADGILCPRGRGPGPGPQDHERRGHLASRTRPGGGSRGLPERGDRGRSGPRALAAGDLAGTPAAAAARPAGRRAIAQGNSPGSSIRHY